MVPIRAPYPDISIDIFIFFLWLLCEIIWLNMPLVYRFKLTCTLISCSVLNIWSTTQQKAMHLIYFFILSETAVNFTHPPMTSINIPSSPAYGVLFHRLHVYMYYKVLLGYILQYLQLCHILFVESCQSYPVHRPMNRVNVKCAILPRKTRATSLWRHKIT